MAMDSLASAAHAAGFAMVPEDDMPGVSGAERAEHKVSADRSLGLSSVNRTVVLAETSARWQGKAQPLTEINLQNTRSSGIFDWMPSFNWRADGRSVGR
jgi:hypothetical protein